MTLATRAPAPEPSPVEGLDPGELRARYRAYRRQQALLLALALPRAAVRPLYRRARDRADAPDSDPLATLTDACEALLPLPPYEVWLRDLAEHPEAHLRDLADWADAPTADRPATVAVRELAYGDTAWAAHLRVHRGPSGWRGHVSFRSGSAPPVRTAPVFHEADPAELCARFMSFDERSLQAFLRSALP